MVFVDMLPSIGARRRLPAAPSVWSCCQAFLLAILASALISPAARAQEEEPGPGLSPNLPYANDIERAAAVANQAAFNRLDPVCNPNGIFDQLADPDATLAPPGCSGTAFLVYLTARELVHTANELQGQGPRVASLGLNQEDLGTALRWTAAEELAAQGSMATQFANSQLSNLSARLSALRFGARGFTTLGFYDPGNGEKGLVVNNDSGVLGGGASADEARQGEAYSPWGGFINGSFGYGDKLDTDREDAFDFDGAEITLGVDYRFENNFVLGAILGYTEQTVDFDEAASSIRVVDGGMESEGRSGILFGLFQGRSAALSASVGYQAIEYDITRAIKYASLNPDIGSANSIARSSPESDILTGTFNFGYAMSLGRFTVEPYVAADYLDVTIDQFNEERSVESLSGSPDDDAFNLVIAEQSFSSLDSALGLRFQFTATPQFGVIVPYASIEAHKELENESRIVQAGYGGLMDAGFDDLFTFAVPTDEIDDSYYTWTVGVSTVLRGGRQRELDGPITGGVMAFVQYKAIESLDNYSEQVVTGGIRYEF